MKRNLKRKIIFSSLLIITLCLSLISGATYALFTSESEINIAITSGNVIVEAKVDNIKTYSMNQEQEKGKFVSGGTAYFSNGLLTLDRLTPGDKITFDIIITNKSNVNVKYRTIISTNSDNGLFAGLKVSIDDVLYDTSSTIKSQYKELNVNANDLIIPVIIELPLGASNAYQDKKCEISYKVEAIQGNAIDKSSWADYAISEEELETLKCVITVGEDKYNAFKISSAEQLAAFAIAVNKGTYNNYCISLENDIDLKNINWVPIGTTSHPYTGRLFEGNNYTISNLKCNGGALLPNDVEATNQGLFGVTYTNGNIVEIKDLTINNVDIYAKNSAGSIVGCLDTAQSVYWQAGYTGIHDINITGKVTIEGGNSGGIAGSPASHWALQTGFSKINIDVEEGSYLSNVNAEKLSGDGVGGALGGIVAVAAWDRGSSDITSNLDIVAFKGTVGGIVGVGNQYFENITYTGNVTIKNVDADTFDITNFNGNSHVIGGIAPVWNHSTMTQARHDSISATGNLIIELSNGTKVILNSSEKDPVGDFFW